MRIQNNLKNSMTFNRDKCRVLHLGRNCQLWKCRVRNNWLAARKRTWGCTGSQVEHESVSCCFAEKANILLGCLNRSVV